MAETVTYTQAVALGIIKARGRINGLTQRRLAFRMQRLGFEWQQQTLARVELAKRPVAAEELLGLALALETTVQELLSPSESDQEAPVTLPSGETVSADYVTRLVYGQSGDAVTWIGEKPEFGPETRRTSPSTRMFGQMMRDASSSRDTTIRVENPAAGTVATFTWQGAKPPYDREG